MLELKLFHQRHKIGLCHLAARVKNRQGSFIGVIQVFEKGLECGKVAPVLLQATVLPATRQATAAATASR